MYKNKDNLATSAWNPKGTLIMTKFTFEKRKMKVKKSEYSTFMFNRGKNGKRLFTK